MANVMGTSCGPEGAIPFGRLPGSTWCDDSVLHVMGVGPLVGLGLLLAAPFMLAAVAMLRSVSWFVVVFLAILAFVGIANWATFWGQLMLAIPLAAIAVVVAGAQHIVSTAVPRRETHSSSSFAPPGDQAHQR
ncbi:hypothetical protein [Williamsia muralis]|uniref:hypothetical protein n=1 Tax=Williamsia marianensis TaxID=85044 RepID=UPI003823D8DF